MKSTYNLDEIESQENTCAFLFVLCIFLSFGNLFILKRIDLSLITLFMTVSFNIDMRYWNTKKFMILFMQQNRREKNMRMK